MDCCSTPAAVAAAPGVHYAILFVTGATMSVGHCAGMCGPLVSGFAISRRSCGEYGGAMAMSFARYHAGRILTYAALGALAAALGSSLGLLDPSLHLTAFLSIAIGLLLLAVSVGPLVSPPSALRELVARANAPVARMLSRGLQSKRGLASFGLGAMNGLLPCGAVFSALLSVTPSDPVRGALGLASFGLGTAPVLALLGFGAARLDPAGRRKWEGVAKLLLAALALQLILRGAASAGWIAHRHLGNVVLF